MEIVLNEKPKGPIIISGFPGVGMVGAIAAEFLIQHLGTKQIGKFFLEKTPPLVAIHEGKLVEPFGIFYSKKYNVVVVHSILAVPGTEWQTGNAILEISRMLNAKEIISMEGVSTPGGDEQEPNKVSRTFYYASSPVKDKAISKQKVARLQEGIIMGPTSAVLMKSGKVPVTCFFAETHSAMPDSNAAAQLIKVLDIYLKLKVDYKPLLQLAAKFEEKLRSIMTQSKQAEDLRDKKQMSYVG